MEQQGTNPYAAPSARVVDDVAAEEAPKLWNPAAGGAWSLLLSVAFGAWITLQNWKALDEPRRINASRIWFIVSVVAFALVLCMPGVGLLGLVYLIVWYFAENRPQINYIREHFGDDYPRRPWLAVILIAFCIALVAGVLCGFASANLFRR